MSKGDSPIETASTEGLAPTTEPAAIAKFLRRTDSDLVIFCTYQSSRQVALAQRGRNVPAFDLVLCDEAHKTAGTKRGGPFRVVLDDEEIRRRATVFMTATPRIYSAAVKAAVEEWDLEIASMDDEEAYGPIAFRLSFGDAIARGLLADYQVAAVGVSEAEVSRAIRERVLLDVGGAPRDAESVATIVALGKAIRRFGLTKIISFHGRVRAASDFADPDTGAPGALSALRLAPEGGVWSAHVSGKMSALERGELLVEFESEERVALLANARCLTEGIDVPDVDAVAFVDPRRSRVDITQAVGRAIRQSRGKEVGTILLPVVIPEGADPERLLDLSDFAQIADVLLALRAHDDRLSETLDEVRTQLGERPATTARKRSSFLREHLVLDLPVGWRAESLLAAVDAEIVRRSTSHLRETLGKLRRFLATHGWEQLRAETVYEGDRIGRWVVQKRRNYKVGRLPDWLRLELESIDGWSWDLLGDRYREILGLLREYLADHGWEGFSRSDTTYKGEDLGDWVANRRQDYRKGKLEPWIVSELESVPGWSWDPLNDERRRKIELLRQYVRVHGIEKLTARSVYKGEKIGVFLGTLKRWRARYRAKETSKPFPAWIEDELDSIPGFSWEPFEDQFAQKLGLLRQYAAEHGLETLTGSTAYQGVRLGLFVETLRALKRGKRMGRTKAQQISPERQAALEAVPGWTWAGRADKEEAAHREKLAALRDFVERRGWQAFRQKTKHRGLPIGQWVNARRSKYNKGQPEKYAWIRSELEAIPGWAWSAQRQRS